MEPVRQKRKFQYGDNRRRKNPLSKTKDGRFSENYNKKFIH